MPTVTCSMCGKEFYVVPYRYKRNINLFNGRFFCSIKCSSKYLRKHGERYGERNPAWKGGVTKQPYACKNCGKTFFRPNVSSKLRNTVKFCSRKCSAEWLSNVHKGRKHYKRFDKLKDEVTIPDDSQVLAYLAGFFDGEGSIFMSKYRRENFTYDFPVLIFSNTFKNVINWIHAKLGGGSIVASKPSTKNHNICYNLRYEALLEVEKILSALLPYMIVKRINAERTLKIVQERINEIKTISEKLYT